MKGVLAVPELTFYRQARVDGGMRSGIELDGNTIYGRFDEGNPEYDPTLLWYVDLRCEGPGLPHEPEDARQWLLSNSRIIREGFQRCAEELRAGSDPDIYPVIWEEFTDVPEGVSMKIAFTAIRRVDAIHLSQRMSEVAAHWEEMIERLSPASAVVN